ncbi:MAG: hypothetical protein V9H26_22715 [Verrucomicrobiota bacterium]
MSLNKSSEELNATVVVATLDAPIPNGKNAIWCASFQSAWKALEELAGESIAFEELPGVAKSLNDATDPLPHVPEGSLYVAAGWNQNDITNQIQNDLKQRFPDKTPAHFPWDLAGIIRRVCLFGGDREILPAIRSKQTTTGFHREWREKSRGRILWPFSREPQWKGQTVGSTTCAVSKG